MSPDLFGHIEPSAPFKDIRNTRESVAEEKARLCAELNQLCRATPHSLANGSVQQVRQWQAAHKSALKILQSKDSSRAQLASAIESMKAWR